MTETAIPKTIHYCWFGSTPLSPLGRRCVQTWREVMPDYAIETWDETRLDRSISYVDIAYRMKKFAFVADYVRMKVLYEQGGLYFDTDIEVLKPFDGLLGESLFMGLQAPGDVGVGVIGAVPGHPFIRSVLDRLDAEARAGTPTFRPMPDLVNELIEKQPPATPRLLPPEWFYPYNPYSPDPLRQKPLQSNMSEQTLCIHHWEGTWLGGASLRRLLDDRIRGAWRKAEHLVRRPLAGLGVR